MKLFLMKLCSLLVVLQGALLLAWYLGLAPVNEIFVKYYSQLLQNGTLPPLAVEVLVCAVLIVVGFVAFLPGRPSRSLRRSVVIKTEHGQVAVQLEALRPALMKVLRRMPEVRKVKLEIKPVKGRGKAHIIAHVSLRQQASLNVSQHVDLITQHIAETAVKLLGLENLVEIDVIVDGIKVNAKMAAREVLSSAEHFRARIAAEEISGTATAALAGGVAAIAATEALPAPADTHPVEMEALELKRPLHEYEEESAGWEEGEDADEEEMLDAVDPGSLPPLNMDPSDSGATFNSDTEDTAYALPPLSEQDAPIEVAEVDEPDATTPVFENAVEQEDVEQEDVEEGEEADTDTEVDPFVNAFGDEEAEAPTLSAPSDDEAVVIEPMGDGAEEAPEEVIPEAIEGNNEPGVAEKKRWGFF